MKFTRFPITIEAFKLGHDPLPQWFIDTSVSLIEEGGWYTLTNPAGATTRVMKGDFIGKSHFPFLVYSCDYFTSNFLLGDLCKAYQLGLELLNAMDESHLDFVNPIELYNSLYEDIRDLRREIISGNKKLIEELLIQIAATSLKAKEDLK